MQHAPEVRGLVLLIPDKPDPERDAVAQIWQQAGGEVVRVARFWDPPGLDARQVRVYGNDTFCLVLAQKLGLSLVSPPDDLLLKLPQTALLRWLRPAVLEDAAALPLPAFVKPAAPKLFRAGVYGSAAELLAETRGLESETPLLVSEVVSFESEVRCWILDEQVLSLAAYEGTCDLAAGRRFATIIARGGALPPSCVLDIGPVAGRGWAVIEANAAWGAGLNGCDPAAAARCIARACA